MHLWCIIIHIIAYLHALKVIYFWNSQGRVIPCDFIGVIKTQQPVYLKGMYMSSPDCKAFNMLPLRSLTLFFALKDIYLCIPHLIFFRGDCEQPWWAHVKLFCTAGRSCLWKGRSSELCFIVVFSQSYLIVDLGISRLQNSCLVRKSRTTLFLTRWCHRFLFLICNSWKL